MGPYKIVFLGASGVGKTALVNRFFKKTFSFHHSPTTEEYTSELVQFSHNCFRIVDVIDTNGADEFPAMRDLRIQQGDAFVVVYSVDNPKSLTTALGYLDDISRVKGSHKVPLILVGNKVGADRQVSTEEGLMKAKNRGLLHLETSACHGYNVTAVFQAMFNSLLSQENAPQKPKKQNTMKNCKPCKRNLSRSKDRRCSIM